MSLPKRMGWMTCRSGWRYVGKHFEGEIRFTEDGTGYDASYVRSADARFERAEVRGEWRARMLSEATDWVERHAALLDV